MPSEASIEENLNTMAGNDHAQDDQQTQQDYQTAMDSLTQEEDVETEEKIPDAVKPEAEHTSVPAFAADVMRPEITLQAKLTGMAAALCLFAILLGAGFVFKQKIAVLWPPSMAIYELAGAPVSLKGQGLVIESLSADILKTEQNQEILVLKGRVVNLTDHAIPVPPLMAILLSTNGEDGDRWVIEPPVTEVEPGASFSFASDYPAVPRGVGAVNLTFIPTIANGQKS